MLFSSIKEINRFRKEINRLLSKGMSNICFRVSIEKKWPTQNIDNVNVKSSSLGQFLGNSKVKQISLNFKNNCYNLKIRSLGTKVCGFSIILSLERFMTS